MRALRQLLHLISLLSVALAEVEFISPIAGDVLKAGDVVTAHWKDSGAVPRISEFTHYDLYLCAGDAMEGSYEEVTVLMNNVAFARGNSVSFKISPEVGGDEPSVYFLKMVSLGPAASVVNYSGQFTLTGMTGAFETPSRVRAELRKRQVEGAYTIPYELQLGPTKYAPMAKKPGSTIPAGKPTPQHPTSAYNIATAYLPPATVQKTESASLTYSVQSIENTASPAPNPQDVHMKRFLERWKD